MLLESPSVLVRAGRGFARELKFVVDASQANAILGWARLNLDVDPHAQGEGYRVTSLYFDTSAFDVYRRRGSYARSKYRIRRYASNPTVFLERKMKRGHCVGKTRCGIPAAELDRLKAETPDRTWPGAWFHRRLHARGLHAVCQVAYERTARVLPTSDGPIRLTLDRNLRALPVHGFAFEGQEGVELLEPGRHVLELKFFGTLPAPFRVLVEETGIAPVQFSKYRAAAAALGLIDA